MFAPVYPYVGQAKVIGGLYDTTSGDRVRLSGTEAGGEPARDILHAEHIAGRGRQRLPSQEAARRDALEGRVDGREQGRRLVATLTRASRDNVVMRCATTPACGETRS